MNIPGLILTNGFLPLLPIFGWNIVLTPKLPAAYGAKNFDRNIPRFILIGENLFRIVVFILPLLLKTGIGGKQGKTGLILYATGCLIYFLSWILLILLPGSGWSRSLWGFTAPAWTPLIWLTGIGLMADSWYFSVSYSPWQYMAPAAAFFLFHMIHSALAYLNNGPAVSSDDRKP